MRDTGRLYRKQPSLFWYLVSGIWNPVSGFLYLCPMVIKSAQYLISSPSFDKCPRPDRPEYAFIGRSNVGKSSLINMLCNNDKLAKTSASPGKTQLINHFEVISSDGSGSRGPEPCWLRKQGSRSLAVPSILQHDTPELGRLTVPSTKDVQLSGAADRLGR